MYDLRIPIATYRLQFDAQFGFNDATSLVDYLNDLGISDIYASPIFSSRKASWNAYDIVDPNSIDPKLGDYPDFKALTSFLSKRGMGLMLDIVPNHMDATQENPWWKDVTEKFSYSPYTAVFDVDWLGFNDRRDVHGRYRRFFDIDGLIGVRVEDPQVFQLTHSLILQLAADNNISGMRVDHVDGLYDPCGYLEHLQQKLLPGQSQHVTMAGKIPTEPSGTASRHSPGSTAGRSKASKCPLNFYVIVEKILSGSETLPEDWPVFGTTGYDFIRLTNAIFVNDEGWNSLIRSYERITGNTASFREIAYRNKVQIINELFPNEIQALGRRLSFLSGVTEPEATNILIEITANLPVYRTYIRDLHPRPADRECIKEAIKQAFVKNPNLQKTIKRVQRGLLLNFPSPFDENQPDLWLEFIRRWQQFTVAITAKGVEDTALYHFNCLISLNEVGGEPDSGGLMVSSWHQWNSRRAAEYPHTLNTTSTHDTKRSEDVRARINVLSEIPAEWERHLKLWMGTNYKYKTILRGRAIPAANIEILLYQTLLGAWPLDSKDIPGFEFRLMKYMEKALREEKTNTSWLKQDKEYEASVLSFTDAVLNNEDFLADFLPFKSRISYYGALNSLSQVLLKIAAPGVPDFYQGNELWDFSLTDPDNRHQVDFDKRKIVLYDLINGNSRVEELFHSWQDGRIKMFLTYKALHLRRQYSKVFETGYYVPLQSTGEAVENSIVFARGLDHDKILIAAGRFFTKFSSLGLLPVGQKAWNKDFVVLPDELVSKQWFNIFSGNSISGSSNTLALSDIFQRLPYALLVARN